MIKVILLRAPCQNVNLLLSNMTFIIFAVFDVKRCIIAINSVINCKLKFFSIIFAVFAIIPNNFIDSESGVTVCNQLRIRRPDT